MKTVRIFLFAAVLFTSASAISEELVLPLSHLDDRHELTINIYFPDDVEARPTGKFADADATIIGYFEFEWIFEGELTYGESVSRTCAYYKKREFGLYEVYKDDGTNRFCEIRGKKAKAGERRYFAAFMMNDDRCIGKPMGRCYLLLRIKSVGPDHSAARKLFSTVGNQALKIVVDGEFKLESFSKR